MGEEIPIFGRFMVGEKMELNGHSKVISLKLTDEIADYYE